MSGTSPDSVSYPVQNYGLLGPLPAYVVNIQDVPGADPTGNDDSTLAINNALASLPDSGGQLVIAPGIYRVSGNLLVKANTVVTGPGTLRMAPIEQWADGSPYWCFANVNNDAAVITDENIRISGVTIDYTDLPAADGSRFAMFMRMVRGVIVDAVSVIGGTDATAFLACDDTLEIGCRYVGFTNCGSDHWEGSTNVRIVGCYMETTVSAQMVNFNPDPTFAPSTGYVASGFTMVGCTIISTENSATPIQIEPLRADASVRDVTITGNTFVNSWLVFRGDTSGVTVSSNSFSGFQGGAEVITAYTRNGGSPGVITVSGNVIRDPLTSSGNEAVVRLATAQGIITGNAVLGTAYTATAFTVTGSANDPLVSGNYVEKGATPSSQRQQTGFTLDNGGSSFYGWADASDTVPRMMLQSDNNWIFQGTDGIGAARVIASIYQRSDSSEMIWAVPTLFQSTMRMAPVEFAAAGTTRTTATGLTANLCRVTSATVPTDCGVRISATNGRPQIVINETDDIIFVWPNDASVPMDGGEPGFAVMLQAGEARSFVYFTDTPVSEIWSYAVAENAVNLSVEEVSAQESFIGAIDLATSPATQPVNYDINHILAYGQSLSIASEGTPGLSTTAKYENLMFGDSIAATQNITPSATWAVVGSAAFNPITPGTDDRENALIGALNTYRMLDFRSRGITSDADVRMLASTCGIGGTAIAELQQGAVPDCFNRLVSCMDQANTYAVTQTLTYGVTALVWMQGESDQLTTQATYAAALRDIYADFCTAAVAETGQASNPAMFMYQTTARNTNYNTTSLGVQMAQLDIGLNDTGCFMVGPVYPMNDSGNLHLPANGYRHWGSQLGKVMHRVLTLGQDWQPLHILSAVRKGQRILVSYYVPFPPLVFDQPWLQTGWTQTDPTIAAANSPFFSEDQGFTVITSGGTVLDIASVVLVSENQVMITLSTGATPTATDYIRYADGLAGHAGHGCLRDSDPAVADDFYKDLQASQAADERNYEFSGQRYPLWNWAVSEQFLITVI